MEESKVVGYSRDKAYLSSQNDGKMPGLGETLIVASYRKKFVLVKDDVIYTTKTLKEMKSYFDGYHVKSITATKLIGIMREQREANQKGYKYIVYNEQSERYEMDGKDLSSGTCLTLLMDGKNWDARVEHNGKKYYAIVTPAAEEPFNVDLDTWNMGKLQ